MTSDRDPALANPYDLDRIEPLGLPESARPRSRAVRRALALGAMSAGLGVVGAGAASADEFGFSDPGAFSDLGDLSFDSPDFDLSSDFSIGEGDFSDIEMTGADLDVPELPDVTVPDDGQAVDLAAADAAAAAVAEQVVPVMDPASAVSPDLSGQIEVSDSDVVVESAPVDEAAQAVADAAAQAVADQAATDAAAQVAAEQAAVVVPVMDPASAVSPDLSGEIEVSGSDLVIESAPVEALPVELAPVDAAPVDAAPVTESAPVADAGASSAVGEVDPSGEIGVLEGTLPIESAVDSEDVAVFAEPAGGEDEGVLVADASDGGLGGTFSQLRAEQERVLGSGEPTYELSDEVVIPEFGSSTEPAPARSEEADPGAGAAALGTPSVGLQRDEDGDLLLGSAGEPEVPTGSLNARPEAPTDTQGRYVPATAFQDGDLRGGVYYTGDEEGDRGGVASLTYGDDQVGAVSFTGRVSDPADVDGAPGDGTGSLSADARLGPNLNRESGINLSAGVSANQPAGGPSSTTVSAGPQVRIGDPDEFPNVEGSYRLQQTTYPSIQLPSGDAAQVDGRVGSVDVNLTPNLSVGYKNIASGESTDNRVALQYSTTFGGGDGAERSTEPGEFDPSDVPVGDGVGADGYRLDDGAPLPTYQLPTDAPDLFGSGELDFTAGGDGAAGTGATPGATAADLRSDARVPGAEDVVPGARGQQGLLTASAGDVVSDIGSGLFDDGRSFEELVGDQTDVLGAAAPEDTDGLSATGGPIRTLPAFDASSYDLLDTDSVVPDGSVVDLADVAPELYLVDPESDPESYRQLEQQLDGEDAPERVSNPFRTLGWGSTGDSTEATGVAAAADRGELLYASAGGFDVSDASTAVTDRQREVLGSADGDGTTLLAQTPLPVPSGNVPLGDPGRGAGGRQTPPPPSNDNLTETQGQFLSPATRESIENVRENPPFGAYGQPFPGQDFRAWADLILRGGGQIAKNGPAIQGVAERDLYYSGINPLLDDIATGNLAISQQSLDLGALGNTLSSAQSVALQGGIRDNAGLVAGTNKEANTLSEATADLNTVSGRNNQIDGFNAGTQQDYSQANQARENDMGNLVRRERLAQGPNELTNEYLAGIAADPDVADAVINKVPPLQVPPAVRDEVAFHRGVMERLGDGEAPAVVVDRLRRTNPEALTSYGDNLRALDPRVPSTREVVSGIYDEVPEAPQLARFDETPFMTAYQQARQNLVDTPTPVNYGTPELTNPTLPARVDPPDVDVNPDRIINERDARVAQLQQLDTAWLGFKTFNPEVVAALGVAGAYVDVEPPNIVATNYYRGDNNKLTARIYQLAENAETSRAQAEQGQQIAFQGITTGAENFDRAVDNNAAITGATIGQIVDTTTGNADAAIARTQGTNALTSDLQQRRGDYSDQLQTAAQQRVEATDDFTQQSGTGGGIGSAGVELYEVQRRLPNLDRTDPEFAGLIRDTFTKHDGAGPAVTRRALRQAVDNLNAQRVGEGRAPVSVDQYIAETPLAAPTGLFTPLTMEQVSRQLSPEAQQRYLQYLSGTDGLTTEQRRLIDGLPPDQRLEFFNTYQGNSPGTGS